MKLEILFPVLNEELRLEKGIKKTLAFLNKSRITDYELLIVDNGSTDATEEIAERLSSDYACVQYLKLCQKGVGLAFREGVLHTNSDIVGYMDIDLSTRITHLQDMMDIFDKDPTVEIVNASRLSHKARMVGRKWYRNLTSYGLTVFMKLFLHMKATDAICGFKFFKRTSLRKLMQNTSDDNGWFYIIELLIRAERARAHIVELPVYWKDEYHTTVKVPNLISNYVKNTFRLRKQLRIENKDRRTHR